jgi:hypothetical protein
MSVEEFITQAMNSQLVKNLETLNLETIFELSFEVAVNVGKLSSSKQEKIDLLVRVVKKVLEELEIKNVSLSALKTSTDSWEAVTEVVETLIPVVFSRLHVMDMPRSFLSFLSCVSASCVSASCVKVEKQVLKVEEQKVEEQKVEKQKVEKQKVEHQTIEEEEEEEEEKKAEEKKVEKRE